jgi:6-phosphogluconolactonase (cycloisomerase 2 family)
MHWECHQRCHVSGFTIDAGTGILTEVPHSPFDAKPAPYSVAVDPAGRFVYVGNDDDNHISAFAIDQATGAPTPVDHSPFDAIGLQPEIRIATSSSSR